MTAKMSQIFSIFCIVAIFAMFTGGFQGTNGMVSYQMDGEKLGITFQDHAPVFIPYEEIEDVEWRDTFSMGDSIESGQWDGGWYGTYENEEYGKYQLYLYSDVGNYIVIHSEQGVLVFNDSTEKSTRQAFQRLQEHIAERKE